MLGSPWQGEVWRVNPKSPGKHPGYVGCGEGGGIRTSPEAAERQVLPPASPRPCQGEEK